MKIIARFLFMLVAGLALILAAVLVMGHVLWPDSMCGGNEEAAMEMRALPEKRLESLFRYSKELYGDGSYQTSISFDAQKISIPKELADLKPKGIRFFGDTLGIHISGCMDDKVYLFVEGLNPEYGHPKIVLSPGEWQGSETLWQR